MDGSHMIHPNLLLKEGKIILLIH